MSTITGIGETVFDIVFRDGRPQAGVPGGSTFNAMISLGRTAARKDPGVRLRMVTQTGDDAVAGLVTAFMKDNRVGDEGLMRSPGQSTVSLAMLDEGGNAHYEFFRDKGLPPFAAPAMDFAPGDFVLFGSFFAISPETREQTRSLVRQAREQGALVYYDINFRKSHQSPDIRSQVEENIALSDIVRGSSEDIEALYGSADAAAVFQAHIAPLCPNFICTRGARETLVFSPEVARSYPVPQDTPIVSTIGAGDNFNAGVLYALTLGPDSGKTPTAGRGPAPDLSLTVSDWDRIVPIAHRFSAEVVASVDNYVRPDFDPDEKK